MQREARVRPTACARLPQWCSLPRHCGPWCDALGSLAVEVQVELTCEVLEGLEALDAWQGCQSVEQLGSPVMRWLESRAPCEPAGWDRGGACLVMLMSLRRDNS